MHDTFLPRQDIVWSLHLTWMDGSRSNYCTKFRGHSRNVQAAKVSSAFSAKPSVDTKVVRTYLHSKVKQVYDTNLCVFDFGVTNRLWVAHVFFTISAVKSRSQTTRSQTTRCCGLECATWSRGLWRQLLGYTRRVVAGVRVCRDTDIPSHTCVCLRRDTDIRVCFICVETVLCCAESLTRVCVCVLFQYTVYRHWVELCRVTDTVLCCVESLCVCRGVGDARIVPIFFVKSFAWMVTFPHLSHCM